MGIRASGVALACVSCMASMPPALHATSLRPIRSVCVDHHALGYRHDDAVRAAIAVLDRVDTRLHWISGTWDCQLTVTVVPSRLHVRNTTLGYQVTGDSHVYVVPARIHGETMFQSVVTHELLHARGCDHVCETPRDLWDHGEFESACSPCGFGHAIMNPWIGDHSPPTMVPTRLDLCEMARSYRDI